MKRTLPILIIIAIVAAIGWDVSTRPAEITVDKIEPHAVVQGRITFARGSNGLGWIVDERNGDKLFVVFTESRFQSPRASAGPDGRFSLRGTRGYLTPVNDVFIVESYEHPAQNAAVRGITI